MIQVTATDFKANFGKYLSLVSHEDIHITKNGNDIAVVSAPETKQSWVDEVTGILPSTKADFDIK